MTKIFISYRRNDSQYVTDSIHDHMIAHFGAENVFLDVGSIPFGVDFRAYLRDQVEKHDVVLVIIGPDWARIMQERADATNDFVRIEIENALKMKKLIVPVLVKNATMPNFATLPESVRDLQWRNSATIRRKPDLEGDCKRLADGIQAYMNSIGAPTRQPPKPKPAPPKPKPTATADAVRAIIGDPFDWCEVPAGEFIYGGDDKAYQSAPREVLNLPTFYMAKYPITYKQFQAFINDKNGFAYPRWWEGLAYKSDETGDQQWKIDDHPRENVSWFEAMAFCRWLSWRLGGSFEVDDITNWAVRLPTEFEWEKAARGTDGRFYPYGDTLDKNKSNTEKSGLGHTTPVTQYPQGASPYGVLDMSGNVWEWCLTDYENPARLAIDENIYSKSIRVSRGGSWHAEAYVESAADGSWNYHRPLGRAVFRSKKSPDTRDYFSGFRVVCLPATD